MNAPTRSRHDSSFAPFTDATRVSGGNVPTAFGFSVRGIAIEASAEPFESLVARAPLADRVRQAIVSVGSMPSPPYARELAARLDFLLEDELEDNPDGPEFSLDSLRALVQFLQVHPDLQRPSVTLGPGGLLVATWRTDRDQELAVEFLHEEAANFAALGAVGDAPASAAQISPRELWTLIESHGIDSWCRR